MFGVVRSIVRAVRNTMAVVVSMLFVARLLGSLIVIGCSIPFVRRLAVWRFRRRLRHSGLDRETVEALTDEYDAGIRIFGHRTSEETIVVV
jgi:hypothetical protein